MTEKEKIAQDDAEVMNLRKGAFQLAIDTMCNSDASDVARMLAAKTVIEMTDYLEKKPASDDG